MGKEPVGKSKVLLYSIHTIKVCELFGTPCYAYIHKYDNDICTRQELYMYLSLANTISLRPPL